MPYFWALLVTCTVGLFFACSSKKVSETATATVTTNPRQTGSCAIVLAPHRGDEALDRQIREQQQAARDAENPAPYLHRLGWSFVAKARTSFDPGYYTLAQESALCLAVYDPTNFDGHLLKGHVLHQLHHFAKAQAIAEKLVHDRGAPPDLLLLGDVHLEQGHLQDAATAYQRAMDLRPSPQVFSRVAQLRRAHGDLDGAITMALASIRAAGPRDHEAAAWGHVSLAQLLMQRGALDDAAKAVVQAFKEQADYPPAFATRGSLELARGNLTQAIADLQHAVARYPHPESQWLLIEALRAQGDHAAASQVEAKLIASGAQEDPRTTSLFLATSKIDPQRALELAQAEVQVRSDARSLDALAWANFALGAFEKADELSQAALASKINEPRVLLHAILIQAKKGDKMAVKHLLAQIETGFATLFPSEKAMLTQIRADMAG